MDGYVFFSPGGEMIIRRSDGVSCHLPVSRVQTKGLYKYTNDYKKVAKMFLKVKDLPKWCPHYCEHLMAEWN